MERKDGYYISITITGEGREDAIILLDKTVKEIKEGVTDCSEHDDTYVPYRRWTCYDREKERKRVSLLFDEATEKYIGMGEDSIGRTWQERKDSQNG